MRSRRAHVTRNSLVPCATHLATVFSPVLLRMGRALKATTRRHSAWLLGLALSQAVCAAPSHDAPALAAKHSYQTRVLALRYGDAQVMANRLAELRPQLPIIAEDKASDAAVQWIIRADPSQNALILLAAPERLRQLESLIQQLDVPSAQVLIETAIIEVAGDLRSIPGVHWATTDAAASNRGFSLGILPDGNRAAAAELSLNALSAVLLADRQSSLLSTPHVLTQEDQPGAIAMHHDLPKPSGRTKEASNSIDVRLTLTAHSNADRNLQLSLEQQLDFTDLAPAKGAAPVPMRRLHSNLLLDNRQVLVIGARLPDSSRASTASRLSQLPLLGQLFGPSEQPKRQRSLLLLLRPSVLAATNAGDSPADNHRAAGLALRAATGATLDLRQASQMPAAAAAHPAPLSAPHPVGQPQRYSIELVSGTNEAFMHALLKLHPTLPLRVVRYTRKGQPWFRVLYGNYPDRQLAELVRRKLPAELPQQRANTVPL
jgi:general secretion pathway protein D